MKKHISILLLGALLFMTGGCNSGHDTIDAYKWRITLDHTEKDPYGAYLAYQSLQYFFPGSKIEALSKGFRLTNMSSEMKYTYNGRSLLILEGLTFHVSENEWNDLKQFIRNGNEVMLFCSTLDDKIEKDLSCYKMSGEESYFQYTDPKDFDNKGILSLHGNTSKRYGYEGRTVKGYFDLTMHDTDQYTSANPNTTSEKNQDEKDEPLVPDTLGMVYEHPDFIRYSIGAGHFTLHAAPLVMSNYFLLQPENINYLNGIWSTLPSDISRIYWTGYLNRSIETSSFDILWRYPATRLGLIIGLMLLGLYVLFEGKRKQRIIPVLPALKNDSVSFVETVGRLYYNKGNHTNLAEKLVQQFMEWVRAHYFLNTNLINEPFINQLTIKSGQPEAKVRGLIEMVHEIRLSTANVDEAYLYQLYNTIQEFYQNKSA